MTAYYNEFDPKAAAWLRELIKRGLIAQGDVDERSIVDVEPADLRGYTQCHFFAGIGVWSYAMRLSGWSDDRPAWSGSCPCQPFSAAGKRKADEDDRHLAPHWLRLIAECRPPVIFGEQVGAAIRVGWLDHVFTALEQHHYACGAVDFPACSVGAPHIRQRLYFVAHQQGNGWGQGRTESAGQQGRIDAAICGSSGGVADTSGGTGQRVAGSFPSAEAKRCGEGQQHGDMPVGHSNGRATGCMAHAEGAELSPHHPEGGWLVGHRAAGLMGNTVCARHEGRQRSGDTELLGSPAEQQFGPAENERRLLKPQRPSATNGFWADAEWIACTDGKARPTEPGTFPLAHGAAARVGRLRGYGNAIVAPQAAEFIAAYMEAT
jgi:DNA (cytosine-5)-methyltransferase 1